jgi:asparagine synthase (glutamine-hydrolysing)
MLSYSPQIWPPVLAREARGPWPDVIADALATHRQRPPLFRLMACDTDTYLPEDILVKVDRASMAHGLEVRAPLLDHRLMELVMRAHPDWIADATGGKLPLRDLFGRHLPASVFSRSKMGFGVPLNVWFRGQMSRYASDRLLDPHAAVAPIINRRAIRRMLWSHGIGQRDESSRIWHLLVLHAWFELWKPSVVRTPGG